MSGKLFIVATPIGNLEDLTPRARQTLAAVDLVAAEDTRHTGRLLSHIGARPRLLALHEHNEAQVVPQLVSLLQEGRSVALVSDAGTPLISDPGYRLVKAAHAQQIAVSPIPGPSAVTAALSVSGLPSDRFCFEGFLPPKKAARRGALQALAEEKRTLIFFESVHRIAGTLDDMCRCFGSARHAFIAREMTKLHEQCVQQTLGQLRERVAEQSIPNKGEFVIVISGSDQDTRSSLDVDRLLDALAGHLSPRDAARVAANATGLRGNDLYDRLLEIRNKIK